jgi:hypothetical protein
MEKAKKGRKPLQNRDELKVQVPIYVRKNHIQKLGGMEKTKHIILLFLENYENR